MGQSARRRSVAPVLGRRRSPDRQLRTPGVPRRMDLSVDRVATRAAGEERRAATGAVWYPREARGGSAEPLEPWTQRMRARVPPTASASGFLMLPQRTQRRRPPRHRATNRVHPTAPHRDQTPLSSGPSAGTGQHETGPNGGRLGASALNPMTESKVDRVDRVARLSATQGRRDVSEHHGSNNSAPPPEPIHPLAHLYAPCQSHDARCAVISSRYL